MIENYTEEQLSRIVDVVNEYKHHDAYLHLKEEFGITLRNYGVLARELRDKKLIRDKQYDKWKPSQIARIKKLVESGYTISEVSCMCGHSKKNLQSLVLKLYGEIPNIPKEGEEWRPCEEYPQFEVSNKGAVRRTDNKCYMKGTKRYGYITIAASKSSRIGIHRLVAKAFIPNPDNKPFVDHINTDRSDNRVENLRWSDPKENMNNEETKRNQERARNLREVLKELFSLESDKLKLIDLILKYNHQTHKRQ